MTNKYDELLIESLSKLKELEFLNIPDADEIDYNFSDEYIKAKDSLLNKLGHSYWKFINTVAKKVAVIIIALTIAFSSLMTVDAFREKIVNFVYKIYTTFTEITIDYKKESNRVERYYSVEKIPKQYIKTTVNKQLDRKITTYWFDKSDNYIMFTQTNLSDSNLFNSEHGIVKEVNINKTPCLICKTNTDYFCYWEFDGYRFELVYPVDLGEEFMSEVVGNLIEIDLAELEN